ncbi:hypothetical protein [Bradyrhizobium sp. LM6.9]
MVTAHCQHVARIKLGFMVVLARAQRVEFRSPSFYAGNRFATLKMRMGATHFLWVTLPKVATEMALCVL